MVLELARRGHASIGTVRSEAKTEIVAEAAENAGVEVATQILDITFRSEMSEQFSAPKDVAGSRYATAYERSGSFYERLGAMMTDVETVAGVIADAIETRSLRARYPVDLDAQFNILSDPITPTGLRDRALRSVFGL